MISYRTRCGYPWRWAVLGEICWRLEHLPFFRWTEENEQTLGFRVCSSVRGWAYRQRKSCEHRGSR